MSYLLEPTHVEDDTNEIVIASRTLAALCDKEQQFEKRKFNAQKFLNKFRDDVGVDFTWSDWSYQNGEARTVETLVFEPEVETLLSQCFEDLRNKRGKRVLLDTGYAHSDKKRKKDDEVRREDARKRAQECHRGILDYHNNLPPHRFTSQVNKHIEKARDYLDRFDACYPKATFPKKAHATSTAKRQLVRIQDNPRPIYSPVKASPRLFSLRTALTTVRSDVRRVLTQGWYEYDLRAAGLSIAASEWNVPELREFLESLKGKSVWEQLADDLGLDVTKVKDGLKRGLYALLYGGGEETVGASMKKGGCDEESVKKFLEHEIVKKIKEGRYWVLHMLERNTIEDEKDLLTALASDIQRKELSLISPVYELLKGNNDVTVMLYQFDGLTIRYKNHQVARHWEPQIKAAVKTKADELGIYTEFVGGQIEAPTLPVPTPAS